MGRAVRARRPTERAAGWGHREHPSPRRRHRRADDGRDPRPDTGRRPRARCRDRAPGSAAWSRLRVSVIPDEEPSPLQRLLAVADSGNGVSSELDLRRWHFINPELTVHLHREPVGELICLDAATTISPGGVGLATSVLSDLDGPVGVRAQTLLVAPR